MHTRIAFANEESLKFCNSEVLKDLVWAPPPISITEQSFQIAVLLSVSDTVDISGSCCR